MAEADELAHLPVALDVGTPEEARVDRQLRHEPLLEKAARAACQDLPQLIRWRALVDLDRASPAAQLVPQLLCQLPLERLRALAVPQQLDRKSVV